MKFYIKVACVFAVVIACCAALGANVFSYDNRSDVPPDRWQGHVPDWSTSGEVVIGGAGCE